MNNQTDYWYKKYLKEKEKNGQIFRWIESLHDSHYIMRYSDSCEFTLKELIEWFKNFMEE